MKLSAYNNKPQENLQRQLDLVRHDVAILLECQKDFQAKLESLQAKSISYEYRLRAIEKTTSKPEVAEGG